MADVRPAVVSGAVPVPAPAPHYYNELEPPELYEHFIAQPPRDFVAWRLTDGTPAFSAALDPLITVEATVRRRLLGLPLVRRWLRNVRLRACFIGTTVSEYVPLARGTDAATFVSTVMQTAEESGRHSLVIVKDMPAMSPLLDDASNAYAGDVTRALAAAGFSILDGQALAWVPIDFARLDKYLDRLSKAARRDVRRKLRSRLAVQVQTIATGDSALRNSTLQADLYRLYLNVYRQSETQFDLLSAAFFARVFQDARLNGRLFLYRYSGRLIGFNLCFLAHGSLVDKYVGFEYPAARLLNLYAVSWMHNLEFAAAHGLAHYVAGWTDPEVKAHLGAQFTLTRHAAYSRNRAVRTALRLLARRLEGDRAWLDGQRHAPAST